MSPPDNADPAESRGHWHAIGLCGRLSIEASAGTGKTWTLAALYLRLLLEGGGGVAALGPERIVVATFTEAAAQELGERLRSRINRALALAREESPAAIDGDGDGEDPVDAWLRARWASDGGLRAGDRQRLLAALARIDQAPIGTLHGLCLRLLREQPLEAGLGFAPAALGDGRRLHEALARDLLRELAAAGPEDPRPALPTGLWSFTTLVATVAFVLQPGVEITPPPDIARLRRELEPVAATLRALGSKEGHYSHLGNAVYRAARAAVDWLDGGPLPGSLAALIDAEEIAKQRVLPAARNRLREPGFAAGIERFQVLFEQHDSIERGFWAHWAPWLRQRLPALSAECAELSFDALIEQACAAMCRPDSPLPDAAHSRWPVALVDEFQDTDGQQYALLDRWFRDRAGQVRGLLAMVGDPKQAIYGFRGGDLHTYLRASDASSARLVLDTNQRSNSRYVQACNALFEAPHDALSSDPEGRIRYTRVNAGMRADARLLYRHGQALARPLVFHALPDALPNAVARPLALRACAETIAELLEPGRYQLGERPLAAGDLAVLLVTHAEIQQLQGELQRRGLPCAGPSRRSVFEGDGARDLLLALHAVRHLGDTGSLRALLLTPLFGLDPAGLARLEAEDGLDAWRERLLQWRQGWDREGVLTVTLALAALAIGRGGPLRERERQATDLRHLGELLQAEEAKGQSPQALLDWLRAQRAGEALAQTPLAAGDRGLRLESDRKRVRLMTLHASKGLEFPVLLLPTLWAHEARSISQGLGPADASGRRAARFERGALRAQAREQQDERFRLLYVALTRAIHACHVFALPQERPARRGGQPAAKADPERSALDALLAGRAELLAASAGIDWRRSWPIPSDCGAFAATAEATADPLSPTTEEGRIEGPGPFHLPQHYSFTRLSAGAQASDRESRAADDEVDETAEPEPAAVTGAEAETPAMADSMLSSVRGKGFGLALHDLLEAFDPEQCYGQRLAEIERALAVHAVHCRQGTPLPQLAVSVAALLDRVLATPLPLPGARCSLRDLPATRRRAELEFHFVLEDFTLAELRRLCADFGETELLPPGRATRLHGSMQGAIDLVFEQEGRHHVLDYKGNALPRLADASPEGLAALMDRHHYRFQAFLYTLALHRMLRQRLAGHYRIERHLGAPIYLFLRAFGLGGAEQPRLGCWSQAFPAGLIEAADRLLAGQRP